MRNCAQRMAEELAREGVRYVFGLPGGEIVSFIDACRRAGLRFIRSGHENSASLMAQALGQITGSPGVCISTLGPGATNLVTGVTNAFLDRAPLLAITAQIPDALYRTMTHQRVDLTQLFAPITKRSILVSEENVTEAVDTAFRLAREPRPGPVHLALPSDVALRACPNSSRSSPSQCRRSTSSAQPLRRVVEKICRSRQPLLIFGLGVPVHCALAARRLVGTLQAPFLVTPKAKGILPENHPLFLGVASGMAIDKTIVETIRMSDLLIGVGFDPVECDSAWFKDVEISIDSVSMKEGDYQPDEVVGELPNLIEELTNLIANPKGWPADLLKARRESIVRSAGNCSNGASPLALVETLRAVFPPEGIVTCDVGSHKLVMGQFWRTFEPGTFFMSNGLSGMGYGIPAAIAASLAHPDKPVLAVVGDGGMLMMLHDLALVRELRLPIVIVVLSDGSLSLIRIAQERRGLIPSGVDFSPPDFSVLAAGFGLCGKRTSKVEEVAEIVEKALVAKSSLVLDVAVDYREYYDLV